MPSESLTWQLCPVVRASFHAVLHSGIDAVSLAAAMQEFSQTVEGLRQAHQLLTASLFRYQAHLFLYLESVGTALAPDGLSPLLDALLCPWPAAVGEALPRRWVAMQPYFYHDIPTTAGDWLRERHSGAQHGRIAVLKPDKWCSYMGVPSKAGERRLAGGGSLASDQRTGKPAVFLSGRTAYPCKYPPPTRCTKRRAARMACC